MKQIYIILFFYLSFSINSYSQSGSALDFDGFNDQINCGNDTSIQITGSEITLEAIIKFKTFKPFTY